MSKIQLLTLCAFLITAGAANADSDVMKTGAYYQVIFAADYRDMHGMDDNDHYVIKIDAVSKWNPNWVQIEFPVDANSSFTSSLKGKRWINLNYIMELSTYEAPPK